MSDPSPPRANLRSEREAPKPGAVTSIQAQKKSPDRVSIFVDGAFGFGIHSEVLMGRNIAVGTHLSEEDIVSLLSEDAYFRAREMAFHLLSYRQRSASEISVRLSGKGIQPEVIARVLDRLKELDLVNDVTFATEYAAARVRAKGYGPLRLRNELFRKGIDSDVIEDAVGSAYGGKTPDELALEAARKIHTRLGRIHDARKRRHQLTSFLARRGFSFDEMAGALNELEAVFGKE